MRNAKMYPNHIPPKTPKPAARKREGRRSGCEHDQGAAGGTTTAPGPDEGRGGARVNEQ
jgi:hypothetical protein